MSIPTQRNSLKNLFPDIVIDNITLSDFWRSWQITKEFKDRVKVFSLVKIKETDRWDTLAEYYYGDRRLWWIIALFNDMDDPFKIYHDKTIPSAVNYIKIIKIEDITLLISEIRKHRLSFDKNA
jgi:hypothetical protein